jgi:hypothetical protein
MNREYIYIIMHVHNSNTSTNVEYDTVKKPEMAATPC